MAYPKNFINELKEVIPSYPSVHHGMSGSPTKSKKFEALVEKYGYSHLLEAHGKNLTYRLFAYGLEQFLTCASPGCNKFLYDIVHNQKYCSRQCSKKDPESLKKLSETKTNLYKDPKWKADVESKKIESRKKLNK